MTSKPSKRLQILKSQVNQARELFAETQPDAVSWLNKQEIDINAIRNQFVKPVGQKIIDEIDSYKSPDALDISLEEQATILEKLREIASLPPGQLDTNESLYLEQQLTDMLGIEILVKYEGKKLPHNYGIIQSGKHYLRYPGDKASLHQDVMEAGFENRRSQFGWLKSFNHDDFEQEKYSLQIQLQMLPEWQTNRRNTQEWFRNKKAIVINPYNQKALVASIMGVGPALSSRRQFIGSPELIRDLEAWSPGAQGRVVAFFVGNTPSNLPLGPVHLTQVA